MPQTVCETSVTVGHGWPCVLDSREARPPSRCIAWTETLVGFPIPGGLAGPATALDAGPGQESASVGFAQSGQTGTALVTSTGLSTQR